MSWRASYSDNLRLMPPGQARGEFYHELAPGLNLLANTPRWNAQLSYLLQRVWFQNEPATLTHNLAANANAILIDDWLYLSGQASINRLSRSSFGPQSADAAVPGSQDTSVRAYGLAPALRHRFTGIAMVEMGYSYENVHTNNQDLATDSSTTSVHIANDDRARAWTWDVRAERKRLNDRELPPVHFSNSSATLRRGITPRFGLSATVGKESNDYQAIAGPSQGSFWSMQADWAPTPRTSVALGAGHRFYGKTYSLDASHRARRSNWRLVYSEDLSTSHAQFLSATAVDTAAMLEQLWSASIPDAALRRQQIAQFLALGQRISVNYFSHGIYVSKRLLGSVAWLGPRSTVLLNLASDRQSGQTTNVVDSKLLPPLEQSLYSQTRNRGLEMVWSHQGGPRASLNGSAAFNTVQSLSTGRSDKNTALRFGVTQNLRRHLSFAADVRHIRHASTSGGDYRENAIAFSFSFHR